MAVTTLTTFVAVGTANADQDGLLLTVTPNVVAVGQATRLVVTGCHNRIGVGAYDEPGVVPSHVVFQANGVDEKYYYADVTAGTKPGVYDLIAGCNGDPNTVTAKLTITAQPYMQLTATPNPVAAGHPVHFVFISCHSNVPSISTPAVAGGTLQLSPGGGGTWMADVRAGDTPGTYRLTALCPDEHSSARLRLVVTPGSSPPPTTPPTATTSTSTRPTPQVPVVPAGAPETGGGGLAAEVSAEPAI